MARTLIKDTCETARQIMGGELDANLGDIMQAVQARKRNMFRPGTRVRFVGTKNPAMDGVEGAVTKVNARTVSVGVGEKDEFGYEKEYNADVALLEVI